MVFVEDFFERVINVQWGAPLAVDVDETGLVSGMAMASKMTISVWFRYSDSAPGGSSTDLTLSNIVPIVSWGGPTVFTTTQVDSGIVTTYSWLEGPSFIGVYTYAGASNLAIRLHSGNRSSALTQPNADNSYRQNGCNYFAVGQQDSITYFSDSVERAVMINVTPGGWHHLLVSFDVPGPFGKIFVVLDGVSYVNGALWPSALYTQSGGGGPNDIVAVYDYPDWAQVEFTTVSSGGFTAQTGPAGVPVQGNLTGHRSGHMQLAALYMFPGVVTSDSDLFLTHAGKPQPLNVAVDALGVPTVLLYPQTDWIQGHNRGSGPKLSAHQTIEKFKPSPELGR